MMELTPETNPKINQLGCPINKYINIAVIAWAIAPIKNAGDNWLKGSDGYYYYTQGVKNGDIVKLAEEGIYFNGLNDNVDMNKYQGKKIKVVANAELVQAKHGVFAEKWGLSENKDGDIYTKLKKISNDQGQ